MTDPKKITKEQFSSILDHATEAWHKLDRIELHIDEIRNDLQSVVRGVKATLYFDTDDNLDQ